MSFGQIVLPYDEAAGLLGLPANMRLIKIEHFISDRSCLVRVEIMDDTDDRQYPEQRNYKNVDPPWNRGKK